MKILTRKINFGTMKANNKERKNMYKCPKGHLVVTIDRDKGNTPFHIGCPECMEQQEDDDKVPMAVSSFYNVPQNMEPTYEWYKPNRKEYKKLKKSHPGLATYIDGGGLILRSIESPKYSKNPKSFKERIELVRRKK